MNKFVLDCSIATAWRSEDDASEVTDSLQAKRSNRVTVGDVLPDCNSYSYCLYPLST